LSPRVSNILKMLETQNDGGIELLEESLLFLMSYVLILMPSF